MPRTTPGRAAALPPPAVALCSSALALIFGACSPSSTSVSVNPVKPQVSDVSGKIADANKALMDSLTKPTSAFHYSYQAQKNINPKFPNQPNSKPEIGPVAVEADVSPDELDVQTTQGAKKTEAKGKKTDPMNYAMAQLALTTSVLDPGVTLAFAGPVAQSAGTESLGALSTNKYDFDTTKATGTQAAGMAIAMGMLGGKIKFNSLKGSAWVDQASGKLVKYNMDAEFSDPSGNSWKEHHEMLLTPK